MQLLCAVSVTFHNMSLTFNTFEAQLPPADSAYIWLDYFVLRQCQDDFNLEAIRTAIKEIGCTLIELDSKRRYLTRAFCIFDTSCAVERRDAKLLVLTQTEPDEMRRALKSTPVNSVEAQTSSKEDKQQIDRFICDTFGFAAFDQQVTDALIAGAEAWEEVEEAPPTDDWGRDTWGPDDFEGQGHHRMGDPKASVSV